MTRNFHQNNQKSSFFTSVPQISNWAALSKRSSQIINALEARGVVGSGVWKQLRRVRIVGSNPACMVDD